MWKTFEATRERNERGQHLTGANSYHDSAAVEDLSAFLPDSLMPLSSVISGGESDTAASADSPRNGQSSSDTSPAALLASADGKRGIASGNASKPEIRALRQRWGTHVASLAKFPDQLGGSAAGGVIRSPGPEDIIGMRVVRGIDIEGDITSTSGRVGLIVRRLPGRRPLRFGITAAQALKEEMEQAKEMAKPDPPTQDEVKLMEFCALKSAAFARDVLTRFETVEASINFCTSNPEAEIEFIAVHPERSVSTTTNEGTVITIINF